MDMVGAGFLPRQRGVESLRRSPWIEHFGGPHERMRTRRAHLPFPRNSGAALGNPVRR